MSEPVIVSTVRTAIGTARKGTLADTSPEDLGVFVVTEAVRRAGLDPSCVGDVILAETAGGGGVLARYAAVVAGMTSVPGQAVNRQCGGSLTGIADAAAQVGSGMEQVVVAGGVHSASLLPTLRRREPGTDDVRDWYAPTHPDTPDAPNLDMTITVGHSTAVAMGISRERMDAWAARSHQRAVAAIDAGAFVEEIAPIEVTRRDGTVVDFAVDEHPRRGSSPDVLAGLRVLHPEIPGFGITAGNSSGINDGAAAVVVTSRDFADAHGLEVLARVKAWGAVGVEPRLTGLGALAATRKVVERAGVGVRDVALFEINEAFASVPIAVCQELGLDEEKVNYNGSGCSLGHPVAATGARQVATLIHELRRRGGGLGLSSMCAAGGMGAGLVIEV